MNAARKHEAGQLLMQLELIGRQLLQLAEDADRAHDKLIALIDFTLRNVPHPPTKAASNPRENHERPN